MKAVLGLSAIVALAAAYSVTTLMAKVTEVLNTAINVAF